MANRDDILEALGHLRLMLPPERHGMVKAATEALDRMERGLKSIADMAVRCLPCLAGAGVTRDAVTHLVRNETGSEIPVCRECCERELAYGNADGLTPVEQPRHVTIARQAIAGRRQRERT